MSQNNLGLYTCKTKVDNKTLDIFSNRTNISLYITVNNF